MRKIWVLLSIADSPLQLALSVVGIAVIIIAAYYTTYFYARKAGGAQRGKNLRMLDRLAFTKDKMVCVVEAAGTVYILAMSASSTTVMDMMSLEEYNSACEKSTGQPHGGFTGVFGSGAKGTRSGAGRFLDIIENLVSREKKVDMDYSEPLRTAREEDDLDIVYRKMQARRAEKYKKPPDEGGGDEE